MNQLIKCIVVVGTIGVFGAPMSASEPDDQQPQQLKLQEQAAGDVGTAPLVQPVAHRHHVHYYHRPYAGHYFRGYDYDGPYNYGRYYYGPPWRYDGWRHHYFYGPPRIGYYDHPYRHGGVRVGPVRVWW
jgi:hypothetical protein